MKKQRILILAITAAIAIAAALYFFLNKGGQDEPVRLIPEREHSVGNIAYFLQNDEKWAKDALGGSNYKMAGSGCLVSCIASSLRAQGIETDPGELNRLFSENGVYNETGDVVWSKIPAVFPGVRVETPSRVDAGKLEKALGEGRYPIVKVKYRGSGYQHWVLLIGSDGNEFLCMEPLNADKEPMPLSQHGGVVYRYRIISVEN